MNILDLTAAIQQIAQTCKRIANEPSPFFFLVGAGISYPSIPLAAGIEEHCRSEAGQNVQVPTDLKSAMQRYEFWFRKAYPQPFERQGYLHGIIQDKPITHET